MKKLFISMITTFISLALLSGIIVKAENYNVYSDRDTRLQQIASKDIKQFNKGALLSVNSSDHSNNKIVQFKKGFDLDTMFKKIDFEYIDFIGNNTTSLFEVSQNDYQIIVLYYLPYIISSEDVIIRKGTSLPNDPFVWRQWGLEKTNYFNVWENMLSSQEVMTCVIDSGISRNHPDIVDVDVRSGWNYLDSGSVVIDPSGHGTSVSGIIAASTNNQIGIAGISNSAIIPLKVAQDNGDITTSNTVKAVYDAVDIGCDVINLSLGSQEYSAAENSAIQHAINNNILVVAAAGNDGSNDLFYPASYLNVISVGSVDQSLTKSTFSNYNDKISLVAPGELILSTGSKSTYSRVSGTSFAAPFVSAVGSVLKSYDKAINQAQFLEVLKLTSSDLGNVGYDNYYGHGLLNIQKIVEMFDKTIPMINVDEGWKFNEENGQWTYLDNNGVAQTGWLKYRDSWYYLNKDTQSRETGWVLVNDAWYYLDEAGVMQTGWIKLNNNWFYLQNSGKMKTGWLKAGNTWYYLRVSGTMQTGWVKLNNTWYYFNSSGAMQIGWLKLNNNWYYLSKSGAMQTGLINVNGKNYFMESSGRLR